VDDFSASAALMTTALRGRAVMFLVIDHEVKLEFTDTGSYTAITVGGPFRLFGASGSADDVDPAHPKTVAPVPHVLRSRLSRGYPMLGRLAVSAAPDHDGADVGPTPG